MNSNNKLPVWHLPRHTRRLNVPTRLWDWLLDSASLTRRLQQACQGSFRVQLLNQGWVRPLRDEARALVLRPGSRAMLREVHLLCDEQPWVFARTVIPRDTLSGKYRRLAHLGNKSLGAMLFADQSMHRSPVKLARISAGRLFDSATRDLSNKPHVIWGRRSLFRIGGKPLLLSEVFLREIS